MSEKPFASFVNVMTFPGNDTLKELKFQGIEHFVLDGDLYVQAAHVKAAQMIFDRMWQRPSVGS